MLMAMPPPIKGDLAPPAEPVPPADPIDAVEAKA
jgi:hypothetical protein